ncbi:type I phosphomannose isomerase catalytic subunit [Planctomyces sp. SH-PL14]|uniref:type I phosphomannose isomerase catalytic subunit n=1 Tax=Planctomyces sp. SH-PL14 TaxID=1632864 RepID=UPI0009ED6AF1|nr:type I phosphomannose isomerase catalytic subunit [Planctomyces sp. SH-PL14]
MSTRPQTPRLEPGPCAAPSGSTLNRRESPSLVSDFRHPIVFDRFHRPQPWGGREMAELFGQKLPRACPYGEFWEISGLPQHPSRVLSGPHAGVTLPELWSQSARQLTGDDGPHEEDFPLLLKWLECRDFVSLQVHPDDGLARQITSERRGKSEASVVVAAGPTSRVYAGLKKGVTPRQFAASLEQGRVLECLHSFTPRVGDCISIPAGTVHATGGGLIVAEVQQASDATFRLHDWGRMGLDGQPRPLQIPEALQAINWDQEPVEPTVPRRLPDSGDGVEMERLLATPHFRLDRYRVSRLWPSVHVGELTMWMVLDGEAELQTADGEFRQSLRRGSSVMIPAEARDPVWTPVQPRGSVTLLCVRIGSGES